MICKAVVVRRIITFIPPKRIYRQGKWFRIYCKSNEKKITLPDKASRQMGRAGAI
jgi:hypothetical protein